MYIKVMYGHNENLLCNPGCAVINLLSSIQSRTGYHNLHLDLCDESGLVKDLDQHYYELATKFLTVNSTYVLVDKQQNPEEYDEGSSPQPPTYSYTSLYDNVADVYPNFKLHCKL